MGGQGNVRMVYTLSNIVQCYITIFQFYCGPNMPQRQIANAERDVQMIVQLGDWTEILWDFVSLRKTMSTLDLTFVLGILTLWERGAAVLGVSTLQPRQLVQGPSREIRFIVFGINRHINHQTSKCNPKEVRSPSIPPTRDGVLNVHLENCQDPLFSDVTWQKVERWDKRYMLF